MRVIIDITKSEENFDYDIQVNLEKNDKFCFGSEFWRICLMDSLDEIMRQLNEQ